MGTGTGNDPATGSNPGLNANGGTLLRSKSKGPQSLAEGDVFINAGVTGADLSSGRSAGVRLGGPLRRRAGMVAEHRDHTIGGTTPLRQSDILSRGT